MAEECSSSLKAMRVKVARRSHPYSRPDPHRVTEVEDPGFPRSMEAEAVRDPDPRKDPGSPRPMEAEAEAEAEAVRDPDPHRLTDVEDPGSPRPMEAEAEAEAEAVRDPDPHCPLEGEAVRDPDSETPESPRQLGVEALSDSAYLALFEAPPRPPKPPPRPDFSSLDVQVVGHFDIRRHCVVVDGCPVPESIEQLHLMDQLNFIKARYNALKSKETKVQGHLHHLESQKSLTNDAIIRSQRIALLSNLFFTGAPMEDSTSHGAHVKAVSGAQCASSARISWSSQSGSSKVLYLEKKLMNLLDAVAEAQVEERELNNEINKLLVEMHQTEKAIYKLKRRATLSSAVPKFVEKIERANCYFDYKEAAKGKYERQIDVEAVLPYQICRRFLKDTDLKSNFDKIDETDIRRAAFAIYSELEKNNNHQPGQESKQLDKKMFVKMKDLTLQEPLYKLVFETREQAKFMDKNPEVELEKIMETNPTLYDACFINGQPGKHLATYEESLKKYSKFWSKYVQVCEG